MDNNTGPNCTQPEYYVPETDAKIYVAATVIISIVGLLGNLLVILSVTLNRHMRTSSNYAMLNLAIGDFILMSLTPILEFRKYLQPFKTSKLQCKFFSSLSIVIQGVTIFTILSLSLDRYKAVAQPKSRSSLNPVNSLLFKLAVIWIVSIGFSIPLTYTANVETYCEFSWCQHLPHGSPEAIAYAIVRFVFMYIVPMLLVVLFYIMMAVKLTDQPATFNSSSGGTSRSQAARKHLAATVMIIAVLFAICWLPLNVNNLVKQFNHDLDHGWIKLLPSISTIFMYMNSCVNPIVLYTRSPLFKKYFRRYLLFGHVSAGPEYTIANDAGTTNITATQQTSEQM
ncbi:bombesin receptor subtype-3-like [Antedon mediterranea]|uniref:bombesin receptor subtype-3-like n=1 Tax=Antedon mediterranea TaxID=105859 RepID=UPI003AF839CA